MAPRAVVVNIALNSVVILGLVICLVLAGIVMNESHKTALLLADTKELAQELRQSSDDLTRFIRTYTVTGNASYWDYFLQVLAIRNGEAPLPAEPWRNYWDLYISDGVAPRHFLPPSSLLSRMEAANFNDEEMELLTEAARQSDALIDLEDVAANAMVGKYRPEDTTGLTDAETKAFSVLAAPNQTLAMSLVHGTPYHIWKGKIMRPLDEFAAKSNDRVLSQIKKNYEMNVILVIVLALMLALLIGLLLFYFLKVARDAQTSQLLGAMLPPRVVTSVSVTDFRDLREVASAHALQIKKKRTKRNKDAEMASLSSATTFPVLYSEYLPVAWVAFTDVVNFTDMCRYTESSRVIGVLNELFSLLDVEALNYGVEKIKTIGDAFMCAKLSTSELDTTSNSEQSRKVSEDGLQIILFLLRAMQLANGVRRPTIDDSVEYLGIRAGLHAGPCASGIVGFERPLYDLFGDTVNTAARLEASGHVNRVHIMSDTLPLLGENLSHLRVDQEELEVELKGIGLAQTRFILGTTSSLVSSRVSSTMDGSSSRLSHVRRMTAAAEMESLSASGHAISIASGNVYLTADDGTDGHSTTGSIHEVHTPMGAEDPGAVPEEENGTK